MELLINITIVLVCLYAILYILPAILIMGTLLSPIILIIAAIVLVIYMPYVLFIIACIIGSLLLMYGYYLLIKEVFM